MKVNVKVFCEGKLVHEVVIERPAGKSDEWVQNAAMATCKFRFMGRQATYSIVKI